MFKKLSGYQFVYIISFIANLGIGMLNFGLVFYVKDKFNTSASLVGLMSGLWALCYLAGCISLRRVSEKLKPLFSVLTAAVSMGLSVIVMLILNSETAVFIAYSFFGFITALYWPPLMGWLSSGLEGRELSKTLSKFNMSWSIGSSISPYIAGILLELYLPLPLWIIASLYVVIAVIVISLIRHNNINKKSHSSEQDSNRKDHSSPLRYACWFGVLSCYLLYGAILFIFPLFARDRLGYSEANIGLLILLMMVMRVAGFQFLSRFHFWHHKRLYIIVSQLGLIVIALLLGFFKNPFMYILLFILFGFVFSLQYSNSIFHGVFGSIKRERRMAIHESMISVGIFAGAMGSGAMYDAFSMTTAFLMCAMVLCILLVVQIFLSKPGKHIAHATHRVKIL